MESLQKLCCHEICLNPEKTLDFGFDDLNLPCLEQIAEKLSLRDLLKYEQRLKLRGIDTEAAINNLQGQLLFRAIDSHMCSTVCPHLLDLCPRDGQNWSLSRSLYSVVIRHLIEQSHSHSGNAYDSDMQSSIIGSSERLLQMFCPPGSSERDFQRKKKALPEDSLRSLLLLTARKILSVTADIKFVRFFSKPCARPVLDIFLERLQGLSILLKSSPLFPDFVKVFKQQARSLKKISLIVIRNKDLQYLDDTLSICSGVMSYYKTREGGKDKAALDSMLGHLAKLFKRSRESDLKLHKDFLEDGIEEINDCHCQLQRAQGSNHEETGSTADTDDSSGSNTCADCCFDLMDDAVLFGSSAPPSSLDNNTGIARADFKFTNLVDSKYYVSVLDHHLRHWMALKELHLGVPDFHPVTVQGVLCLLKRPHFKSFTLSSAAVSFKDMEDMLTTIASFRGSQPLERLMFVSLSTRNNNTSFAAVDEDLLTDGEEFDNHSHSMYSWSHSHCSGFQGTELLEIYCCGFNLKTEQLLKQFLCKDLALKVLCLSNSFKVSMVKSTLQTLASSDQKQSLHRLILEDWPIASDSSCAILKTFLKKMAPTLTSLSLKGCLLDRTSFAVGELILGVSECANLETLDLSENMLGDDAIRFSGAVMKSTRLKELSLKDNRLPAGTTIETMTALQDASKCRESRLKVLDMRGNKFVQDGKNRPKVLEDTIHTLQRSFVDKILYTMEES
ncbi:hypothetical protein PoB_003366200 [Plakobranchus ocellatus]|uniref:Uncharacterized protein n=1 Tax=Plakobranchus ocellatus TaxID=259542 RepID=A0AAV4AJH8_9GAST|nr:hypothetical protein PoB_003366200 [Plakobranchus ocellatus]